MKTVIAIIILALVAWGVFALMDNNSAPATETAQEQNEEIQNNNNPAGDTELATREFTVTGTSFTFAPAVMEVNKGERVRITFVNSGGTHDLVVDGYDVRTKVLQAGQSETIEFIADESGTFEYYCSVGTHRQMGMKGTLVVQ